MKTAMMTIAFMLIASTSAYEQVPYTDDNTLPDFTNLPSTDPVVVDPVGTEPAPTTPVVTDPVVAGPIVTDPVVTDPVVTEPVITDPVAGVPVVTTPGEDDGGGKHGRNKKPRKPNFGMLVSAEAHRLKGEGLNGTQKMGGWVSDQRRQNVAGAKQIAAKGPSERGSVGNAGTSGGSSNSASGNKGQSNGRRK